MSEIGTWMNSVNAASVAFVITIFFVSATVWYSNVWYRLIFAMLTILIVFGGFESAINAEQTKEFFSVIRDTYLPRHTSKWSF